MFQPLTGGFYASAGTVIGTQSVPVAIPLPQSHSHTSHSVVRQVSAPVLTHGHQRPKVTKPLNRRDKSEISCCLKYLIFGSNVVFWVFGLSIMVVGFWAWTEKDIFNNFSRITNLALDPAFILIVCGCIGFTIGFTGCVGALRENTCLLAGVSAERHFFII